MKVVSQLLIESSRVPAGAEWEDRSVAWRFVRIHSGFGYWLGRTAHLELNCGDVLVLGAAVEGTLRASQIAPLLLNYFYLSPEQLAGVMSLAEREALETASSNHEATIIRANDPAAREFADIVAQGGERRDLAIRGQLLHLAGVLLNDTLPVRRLRVPLVPTSSTRVADLLSRMPESELLRCSPAELAEMCGCSLRHFRRLFRKEFNTSVRARQTQLRLEKARQLLVETNDSIGRIAELCGYRHVGLFNALFKRRFGVTPGAWREMARESTPAILSSASQ